MHQIVAWLERLRRSENDDESLVERYFRIVVPGPTPFAITNCLIAATPIGKLPPMPGDSSPKSMSLLRVPDVEQADRPVEIERQLTSELAAVLSLTTDRRIEIPHELALSIVGQATVTFIGYGSAFDHRLNGPIDSPVIEPFHDLLSNLSSLSEHDLSAIGSACMLHHGAVLLFDSDIRSAYLLLVAGIEVLSREYGSPPIAWAEWDESSEWDRFLDTLALPSETVESIKTQLFKNKHLRLKATFWHYAANRLPDTFWDQPWQEWTQSVDASRGCWNNPTALPVETVSQFLSSDRILLAKSLGKCYDLRSGLVHRGTRLDLMTAARLQHRHIAEPQILPFSVLRAILVALIRQEIEDHATAAPLPGLRAVSP